MPRAASESKLLTASLSSLNPVTSNGQGWRHRRKDTLEEAISKENNNHKTTTSKPKPITQSSLSYFG